MNVYKCLRTDSSYKKDDIVTGTVYQINAQVGAYVAVDDCYSALIPNRELFGEIKAGGTVKARIAEVKPDGKLDLSVRETAYLQMEKDAHKIMEIMERLDGVLPFTDKASPELIKKETGMSKNEFKRAVGRLLKNGEIVIKTDCIVLKK